MRRSRASAGYPSAAALRLKPEASASCGLDARAELATILAPLLPEAMRKRILILSACAGLWLGPLPLAEAQPRDAVVREVAKEEAAAETAAVAADDIANDPAFIRSQREKAQREADAEARFQALPWYEKLFRWALIPMAFWALYTWIGRPKK